MFQQTVSECGNGDRSCLCSARERRREKRLAARQKVEEAINVTQFENKKAVSEEDIANSETELGASENVTEKEPFKIPQIDGLVTD